MGFSAGFGLADIFGAGAAAAAEAAPAAADLAAAGEAATGFAADATAADIAAAFGTTDLGALEAGAGSAGAADVLGAGAGDVLAGGGGLIGGLSPDVAANLAATTGVDALGGVGNVANALPANTMALAGGAVDPSAAASTALATPGGGATPFGGVQTATEAITQPTDLTQISGGGNLGGLTNADTGAAGTKFASLNNPNVVSDINASNSVDVGYTGLDKATNLAPPDASTITNAANPPVPGTLGNNLPTAPLDTGEGLSPVAQASSTTVASTAAPPATPPPAGNAPPPSGGGAGGGFDWWKAAGLGLAAAPLGITLARGEPSLPSQSGQAQGLASTVGAGGQQLLQSALTNTPMPGQQAILNQDRQSQVNALAQQIFNQTGTSDVTKDPRWLPSLRLIDQNIAAEQQQFITANLNAALQATGQASGTLSSIAQQQIALDTSYQQAIANAGRSLGTVAGAAGLNSLLNSRTA